MADYVTWKLDFRDKIDYEELNKKIDSFIKQNKICDINAVYPPTTACAVPALCSGVEPLKTGWVGWSNYFSEVDKYVVMFRNLEYYSNEPVSINIEKDILPYKKFYEDFDTYKFELGPSFTPSNCQSFLEMCDRYIEETKDKKSSFCYMYWTEPDTVMHINGAYSIEAKNELKMMDETLKKMHERLSDDTLIIITADHGCDPTYKGTDHTRERVPVILFGKNIKEENIDNRQNKHKIEDSEGRNKLWQLNL